MPSDRLMVRDIPPRTVFGLRGTQVLCMNADGGLRSGNRVWLHSVVGEKGSLCLGLQDPFEYVPSPAVAVLCPLPEGKLSLMNPFRH